ncbi:hypothetical protein DOT_4998 [Desulfosporosinus sp. OT]|nr:hypothetical protein DOT_4998 [Desulfosporosinus sp. OT]
MNISQLRLLFLTKLIFRKFLTFDFRGVRLVMLILNTPEREEVLKNLKVIVNTEV